MKLVNLENRGECEAIFMRLDSSNIRGTLTKDIAISWSGTNSSINIWIDNDNKFRGHISKYCEIIHSTCKDTIEEIEQWFLERREILGEGVLSLDKRRGVIEINKNLYIQMLQTPKALSLLFSRFIPYAIVNNDSFGIDYSSRYYGFSLEFEPVEEGSSANRYSATFTEQFNRESGLMEYKLDFDKILN